MKNGQMIYFGPHDAAAMQVRSDLAWVGVGETVMRLEGLLSPVTRIT